MKTTQVIKISSFYTWDDFKNLYGPANEINENEDIYSLNLKDYGKPLWDKFGIS